MDINPIFKMMVIQWKNRNYKFYTQHRTGLNVIRKKKTCRIILYELLITSLTYMNMCGGNIHFVLFFYEHFLTFLGPELDSTLCTWNPRCGTTSENSDRTQQK